MLASIGEITSKMAQPIDFLSSEDEIYRRDTADFEQVAEEEEEEQEETD